MIADFEAEFSLEVAVIRLPLITAALVAVLWWLFHISKRKSLRVVLIVFAIIIALPLGLLFAQWGYELNMRLRAGRITAQLESYRASHGKCPVSLSDLEIREVNGPIYYERDFDSPFEYYLWFGTGVGTVSQYDSKTRIWHAPQ